MSSLSFFAISVALDGKQQGADDDIGLAIRAGWLHFAGGLTQTDVAQRLQIAPLSGISKHFGAVSALTHIDLDVRAGEVVALVGENGAGKSTLVKILAGVHQASAGWSRRDGRE